MSEPFATATVQITPKLTGFVKDLDGLLKVAMEKVKPPVIRVRPALTVDFVGDLRRQVNAAILKAQSGVKPIRVKALIEPVGVTAGAVGRIPTGGGGGGGAGGSGGGGGVGGATGNSLTALARSQELVATAQLHLNRAFDETLPIQQQVAAVSKISTTLAEAQAAAEKTLAKAIVAKDAVMQRSARKQLSAIADFERTFAPRAAQVAAAATPKVGPLSNTAVAQTRKNADAIKLVVAGLRETNTVSKTLTGTTKDLAAQQVLLTRQKNLLTAATKAATSSQAAGNQVVRAAALNAQNAAQAQVNATNQQIEAIKRLQRLEQQSAALRSKQAAAAARSASADKRRSEQLSRGGQASLLSLAGIRGATLAASRSFLVGAAAITVFARAVKQFADLERNLHVFAATTQATAQEMEAVRKEATALGADLTLPAVSAGDAAGAMVELSKAGLSVQDAIDGARAVLELSTAAAIENAEAVRLVANVLNAFNLSGKEAADVSDTLANAANAAQGSIADIGTAFQQAASAGKQVGLSFQDTATFLTILAKNGIRGADAGTSLRTALIRLINPSKEAAARFKELGITLRDSAGNLRPDIFLQIAAATSRLTPAMRDATFALIGGQDAFRAVTILGRQSVASFLAMRAALREEGTAAELAKARTDGLHGSIDGLQSVLETVGTNLARNVGPGLAGFVHSISAGITALSENEQVATSLNQSLNVTKQTFNALGTAIQGVGAVALPVANALAQVATSIGVGTILAGVVAWKAFNAVLDGAILRMTVLRPLIGVIATARIGASLSTGLTAASIALEQFNKSAGAVGGAPVAGFARLTQVQRELAVATAASTARMSTFSVVTSGLRSALSSIVTPTTAAVAAVTALAVGVFILATRESDAEKATKAFKSAIEGLATAMGESQTNLDSYHQSLRTIASSKAAVEQAKQALAISRTAVATSQASKTSADYQRLLAGLAIARQNAQFAEEDYAKAIRDAGVQAEIAAQAQRNLQDARTKAAASVKLLLTLEKLDRSALPLNIRMTKAFEDRAKALREQNTAESLFLAKRLELLAKISLQEGAPSPHAIELIIETPKLKSALAGVAREFGATGPEAVDAFVNGWIAELNGTGAAKIRAHWQSVIQGVTKFFPSVKSQAVVSGEEAGDNWMAAAAAAARKREKELEDALTAAFAAAERKASLAQRRLQTQQDLAVIASASPTATLATEQDALAQAIADRQRAEARIAHLRATGQETGLDTAVKARADAIARQRATTEAIRGMNEQAANDAKSAAEEAKQKQEQIFSDLLEAMGLARDRRQEAIEDARLTEGLADDIAMTRKLRRLAARQIATIVGRIAAARAQGKNVKVLIDGLRTLRRVWRELGRDIIGLQKDQQQALRDILFERFDLRIQIAQSREDVAAELRIRRQKLGELTKELVRIRRAYGKNSIEWLRAKAAQAEEIAAIRELEGQTKERNNALSALMFEFLQAQQGFTANLLGNLFPVNPMPLGGGAGGVPVGGAGMGAGIGAALGGVPVPSGRGPRDKLQATQATASAQGSTAGQMSSLIEINRQMLGVLKALAGNKQHPEAKMAAATVRAKHGNV